MNSEKTVVMWICRYMYSFFFFNDTATTEIYTLSLHDALPIRPKAGTTAPAGSTSILRSPPVMSLTFLAKSSAYSWKMSFDGHVLWKRMLIGPCALTTLGAAMAAAPAPRAPVLRNLRRVTLLAVLLLIVSSSCCKTTLQRR